MVVFYFIELRQCLFLPNCAQWVDFNPVRRPDHTICVKCSSRYEFLDIIVLQQRHIAGQNKPRDLRISTMGRAQASRWPRQFDIVHYRRKVRANISGISRLSDGNKATVDMLLKEIKSAL